MRPTRSATIDAEAPSESLLGDFLGGERGRALRSQLELRHPERSDEEIADALQAACGHFLAEAEGITAPGQVYAWIRTAAHHLLLHEDREREREPASDPSNQDFELRLGEHPSSEREAIRREEKADLATLVGELTSSLSERQRQVLALHLEGLKRPQIAARLGTSRRIVKRDLEEVMDGARGTLARLSGGGCEHGEPAVMRLAYGLAEPLEAAQARLHLHRCGRCGALYERLEGWRETAAAVLPAPAAEAASPGLIERVAHKAADGFAAAKRGLLGGGAQVKQHIAERYPAVDPTPIAGARPGTVVAVVASCITLGAAGATYCVKSGIDPLGAAKGLLGEAGGESKQAPPSPPKAAAPPPAPVEPPPPVSEAPPASKAAPPAEAKKESPPPSPPPEASFEPSSPNYPYSSSEAAHTERPRPAPVPPNSPPEFEGP